MLEELLTISKSRQASQSGSTNAANMDIAPFKTLIEEAGQRTEAGLAKFAGNITDCLNAINNRIDGIARRENIGTIITRPGTRLRLRTDGTGRLSSVSSF